MTTSISERSGLVHLNDDLTTKIAIDLKQKRRVWQYESEAIKTLIRDKNLASLELSYKNEEQKDFMVDVIKRSFDARHYYSIHTFYDQKGFYHISLERK